MRVVEQIQRLQGNELTVLITGESGTGKELVARAIHVGSLRSSAVFLPYNCTTTTRELADTQLSDKGLARLHGLSKLKSLDISRTRVTQAGAEAFRKALPEAKLAYSLAPPRAMINGIKNPESVVVARGNIFVTEIGERDKDGDGKVLVIGGDLRTRRANGAELRRWRLAAPKLQEGRTCSTCEEV